MFKRFTHVPYFARKLFGSGSSSTSEPEPEPGPDDSTSSNKNSGDKSGMTTGKWIFFSFCMLFLGMAIASALTDPMLNTFPQRHPKIEKTARPVKKIKKIKKVVKPTKNKPVENKPTKNKPAEDKPARGREGVLKIHDRHTGKVKEVYEIPGAETIDYSNSGYDLVPDPFKQNTDKKEESK